MTQWSVPIVDRVTDPFFTLDTDFRFTYLNESAEELLTRPREQILGRVMWDEFPETVETQFPDGFYHAMDEQVSVSFEVYHTPLETWFEARAFPSADGLSVHMRDITDRKRRENDLAQHAAVVESVHEGVVTLDKHTRITLINEIIEDVLDIDRSDVIGEHLETILDAASVGSEDAMAIGQAVSEVDVGNTPFRTLEIEFTNAHGETQVGELRVVPIEHRTASVAVVVRDVTGQREYERVITSLHELTRWLLESDDPEEICAIAVHAGSDLLSLEISGVWLLDDEYGALTPVAGTAGAHDQFGGLPTFSQGEGLVWDVFQSGEPELFDDLGERDDVYNPETVLRSEIIAPIGTHGVLMTGAFEPGAFDETDLELLSTLAENTRAALDRTEREHVLRERTAEIERHQERLETVADVLSSDLTRQLEAINEVLDEDDAVPEDLELEFAGEPVTSLLDRADTLLDNVRAYVRNATGVRRRTRIDLEDAISEAVETSQLENPAVVVEDTATLRADPDRFEHMLETIFDNAATRADSTVTIQAGLLGIEEPTADTRGFFLLDDAAELPRVIQNGETDHGRPVSGDESTVRFGLSLVHAIANAHNWSVSVDTGPRGGTRFEIRDVTTLEPA